ncbi:MAG: hypothetical protein R3C14_39815 [Caldilineaceae bacterium]
MRTLYVFILFIITFTQTSLPVFATPLHQATPQWIFFYSLKLQIDGSTAEGGTVIGAYISRTGQQCGAQKVTASGALPLLTCYMADPASNTDGVVGGDLIFFTVDGVQAAESYRLPATIFNGQRFELRSLTTTTTSSKKSCIDGYEGVEGDDTKELANSITGPEAHTFYNRKRKWDRDWGVFTAKAKHIYQIQARSSQPFGITHPVLYLYDEQGALLDQNELDKWGRGAEIWWWNGGDKDQKLYLLAEEKNGQFGCRHYTLTITAWSQAEFAARFEN